MAMRKAGRAIIIHNQNMLLMKRNKFGDEYYCLLGGNLEVGEAADRAAVREVKEEASIDVVNPRLVFIEHSADIFGTQYIFVCDYKDGDVHLAPDSIEAKIHEGGKNLYEPMWVPVSKFAGLRFRSSVLQQEILAALRDGFPKEPKSLQSDAEISYTKPD